MSVVDREEGGRDALGKLDVEMRSLITASKILGK